MVLCNILPQVISQQPSKRNKSAIEYRLLTQFIGVQIING
jgi:hypothetical protein